MSTAATVPETRGELEGEDALHALRSCGRVHLLRDAIDRFRAADGFSHSRALAFQFVLTIVPAAIALVGGAAAADQESVRRVVEDTLTTVAPGAVGDLLTEALRQGEVQARQENGETALAGGGLAALLAGATAMAQVERGANRLYGTERDRPFVRKYGLAVGLALSAGVAVLAGLMILVGGSAIRRSAGFPDWLDTTWALARWPLGVALVVGALALLFQVAPRRRQPEPSWLAFGASVSALLWLAFMGVLTLYAEVSGTFGATYGPLAGLVGILLWAFLSALALFLGIAVAAQLEAVRSGNPRTRREEASG